MPTPDPETLPETPSRQPRGDTGDGPDAAAEAGTPVLAAVLAAEQDHLDRSRAALRRMRDRTGRLQAHGGDHVSTEHLKATLWHRAQALADDPGTPLFFGRLDYQQGSRYADDAPGPDQAESEAADRAGARFYIGRRHVKDEDGEPMVVDWRAQVCVPFYRAGPATPMGVRLRRRFGFSHGALTGYEDERLDRPAGAGPGSERPGETGAAASGSRILEQEIERPRVGPMRDIVATIQPEQDQIVRAELSRTVCVQGAPGTGKTAVGLHRAAYLLYAHRDQLRRQGVLVVGPTDSFLRYIGDVLPALGEIDARQVTVDAVASRVRVRGTDEPAVAVLKGDARMAEVLRRALWSHLGRPTEALVLARGSRRFRVPAYEAAEILDGVRGRGVRYGAGRSMLPQRLAHALLLRMEAEGDTPDDRVQNSVARSAPVRAYAGALWPPVEPAKLVFGLLSDAEFLAQHAAGLLAESEQAALHWSRPPRGVGSARWSPADAVLVDEAADLIERTPSLGHIVVDEAQDLSAMQLRAVGRRCSTGSATILGDLAQATTPWASTSWTTALRHLGKPEAHLEELTAGFRVPADLLAFAARLLPAIAPTLTPPSSVRRGRGDLAVIPVGAAARAGRRSADPLPAAVAATGRALERAGSVGVIVPDALIRPLRRALDAADLAYAELGEESDVDARLDVVPASLAKGLEFDHVVVAEPAAIVDAEPDEATGLRRLYVCLTRAVSSLAVVHARPLPPLLET